jgi:hypothetical protein
MMAAESPGESDIDTFERTWSGPRDVGYSLLRPSTSSTGSPSAGAGLVAVERLEPGREALGVVGFDEQAAACPLDDLGKGPAARLHHRHPACHRLEQ